MDEFCNCARGLGTAAETLFFAMTFQAAAMALAVGIILTFA